MTKKVIHQNEVTTGEPLEKGGYFVAYNYVMRNAMRVFNLNSGEYACLTMLFSYAGADKDKCFPSQEALAEDLNLKDPRSVRRYLDALESKGVITIYNRQNSKNLKITNIYDLSPCLSKIRELYCKNDEESSGDFGVKITKKSRKNGQDNSVLSENTGSESSEHSEGNSEFGESHNDGQDNSVLSENNDRTELSEQTGQNCPTTSNTIHITSNNHNIYKHNIDDDKRTSPSGEDSAKHNDDYINMIINLLRESTKDELTDRSFKSVVRKVVDKYNQGKVGNFRDYLATSLANKIEELELRRIKENAKSAIKESKITRANELYEEYMNQTENVEPRNYKDLPLYNWLEE